MQRRKSKTDHIVMWNGGFLCENCGETYVPQLPAAIQMYLAQSNTFTKMHKNCEKGWSHPEPDMKWTQSERMLFWYKHGEHGISSKTMFQILSQGKHGKLGELGIIPLQIISGMEFGHPHDPDDFRRCYRLLQVLPEWRKELHKMKKISPVWSALVDNWDKLTEMLEEMMETKKVNGMYDFMKELGT